jgi:hypothetical protein
MNYYLPGVRDIPFLEVRPSIGSTLVALKKSGRLTKVAQELLAQYQPQNEDQHAWYRSKPNSKCAEVEKNIVDDRY